MNVSMNKQATVTLTEAGASMFNQWNMQFPASVRANKALAGSMFKAQLWELFQIFGSSIYMGMVEVPFVDNVIDLEETL